ncbi:MAG: ABC transporter permease [Acidobacteriia bacterium]|nr:ABC transporter permease [Terriglobia bacterium]
MPARLRTFASRLARLFRRGAPDSAFDDELEGHIGLLTERYVRQGMTPEDARYAARRQFGNQTALREERNEMQTFASWDRLAQDLRYGLRLLVRNPGVTAAALLTLSLGIGANTAVFSLVEGLLLKPLPYQDAARLVVPATIFQRHKSDRGSVAYADVLDWRAQSSLFEAVAAFRPTGLDLTGDEEPERVQALVVDEDYFRVMGRPMRYGRPLALGDNLPGAPTAAVLGHALWTRRFGADPGVVGRNVEINGAQVLVAGVVQPDSTWPEDAEVFLPLKIAGARDADTLRRDNHIYQSVARLARGVSLQQVQSRLSVMGGRIAQQFTNRAGTNWKLHTLAGYIVEPYLRQTLLVLFAASLLVLLIAYVNLANLLLARGATRAHEVAIRNALGAGWKRLAQQFLAESALLALGGGLAGILAGKWGLKILLRLAPPDIPRLAGVHIDLTVLAFATALCLVAVVFAGLVPALHAARQAPVEVLRETARGASQGLRGGRIRRLLVVAEFALAIILLTGAGLLVRSFQRIRRIDPGFPTANLLTLQVALPRARYPGPPQYAAGFEQLTTSLRRIPGVVSTSATSSLPVDGGGFYLGRVFLREGQPEPPASADTAAAWSVVQPGYFATMRIPLAAGREFTDRDTADSPLVIVISRAMARQMFPNQSPLGQRIRSWRDENKYREIVGVAGDLRYNGLTDDIGNNVYVPHRQDSWSRLQLVVRTARDPHILLSSIRSQIWSIDRKLSISAVQTMDQVVENHMAQPRFCMFLLCVFGGAALLLAAIGIFGVMAYSVAERTREFGIRIAMGALRADVLRLVAFGAVRLAGAGILCGLAGAFALTRLMKALLYDVSPTDAATFLLVSALLTLVALAAAYLPAHRAAKVDPVVTLRYE